MPSGASRSVEWWQDGSSLLAQPCQLRVLSYERNRRSNRPASLPPGQERCAVITVGCYCFLAVNEPVGLPPTAISPSISVADLSLPSYETVSCWPW